MMNQRKAREKLVDHLQNAHAMEANIVVMLGSMILSTPDRKIVRLLRQHVDETRAQMGRLTERLAALGAGPSLRKEATLMAGTALKGVTDQLRGDKPIQNARDAYMTEAMEIATYQLLERAALAAGDSESADVARLNRQEEEEMARAIEASWDRFVALSLIQEGVAA